MRQTEKEKLETRAVPLQIITKNAIEETDAVDDYIEVALKKRKREAEVPLYLKRV